jgi:hypothetical protein
LLVFYTEPPPILFKDSASREQNKISLLVFYAEAKPMLSKDNTIHRNNHHKKQPPMGIPIGGQICRYQFF